MSKKSNTTIYKAVKQIPATDNDKVTKNKTMRDTFKIKGLKRTSTKKINAVVGRPRINSNSKPTGTSTSMSHSICKTKQ